MGGGRRAVMLFEEVMLVEVKAALLKFSFIVDARRWFKLVGGYQETMHSDRNVI